MNHTNTGKTRTEIQRRLVPFAGALCLFFSAIEYLFPKPLPFFRLGLANIPILLLLGSIPVGSMCILLLLKVLGQAILNGTLVSYVFIFSLFGTFSGGLAMVLVYSVGKKQISLIGVSVIGALVSNAVQILLAIIWIFGSSAWIIAPVFLGMGSLSGLVVGLVAAYFSRNSRWIEEIRRSLGGQVSLSCNGQAQEESRNV